MFVLFIFIFENGRVYSILCNCMCSYVYTFACVCAWYVFECVNAKEFACARRQNISGYIENDTLEAP